MSSVAVAIIARDEERCIARCLNSVTGQGFADILVVDTGSVDRTVDIVTGYRDVRLERVPWRDSFAAVRNHAIEAAAADWVVFVDADEWLPPHSAARLSSLPEGDAFAPRIRDTHHHTVAVDVARVLRTDSGIRYRGLVHEYLVHADQAPVDVVGLDVEFLHDGYHPDIARAKDKRARNLRLLDAAMAAEPANPRWPCFRVRDAGADITATELMDLCARVGGLVGAQTHTGDAYSPLHYYRVAVAFACQALTAMGEPDLVNRLCDRLDAVDDHNPDAHYFRSMIRLGQATMTSRDLLRSITIREDDALVAASVLDASGRHLDALIGLQLELFRGAGEADRYRGLSRPWSDGFFDRSRPRTAT